MKCANETCRRNVIWRGRGPHPVYCSRLCQTRPDGYNLNRVTLPLWMVHELEHYAKSEGISFQQAVIDAVFDLINP